MMYDPNAEAAAMEEQAVEQVRGHCIAWLETVQQNQDIGASWGRSVAEADAAVRSAANGFRIDSKEV